MKLPKLECIEVEVSDWEPAPMTFAALRALTNELKLYCPSVLRVVFVYNFDRIVITAFNDGSGGCSLDEDLEADFIWREV